MEENSLMGLLIKTPKRKKEILNSTDSELEKIIDFSKITSRLSIRRRLGSLVQDARVGIALDSFNCTLCVILCI
jgi:hypothetical protein